MVSTFGGTRTESVQHLLALMGTAVLDHEPRVTEISLRMESTSLAATAFGTGGGARTFAATTTPGAVTELTVHRKAP
jgi:urate oxidase